MRKKFLQITAFSFLALALNASTGYAQTYPSGPYESTCPQDVGMKGTSLCGKCYENNGSSLKTSCLQDAWQCTQLINNCDGKLICGNCPSPQLAPPSGSYLKSCTSPEISGSDLWATCTYCNGEIHQAVLYNYASCTKDIHNCNGVLTCGKCDSPCPQSSPSKNMH